MNYTSDQLLKALVAEQTGEVLDEIYKPDPKSLRLANDLWIVLKDIDPESSYGKEISLKLKDSLKNWSQYPKVNELLNALEWVSMQHGTQPAKILKLVIKALGTSEAERWHREHL